MTSGRFTVAEVRRAIRAAEREGPDWIVRIAQDGAIEIARRLPAQPQARDEGETSNRSFGPDDPILLKTALSVTTLRGLMNLSQMRRRVENGQLQAYRIAGKLFTTLKAVEDMRRVFGDPAPRTVAQRHGALKAVAAMQIYHRREAEKRREGRAIK